MPGRPKLSLNYPPGPKKKVDDSVEEEVVFDRYAAQGEATRALDELKEYMKATGVKNMEVKDEWKKALATRAAITKDIEEYAKATLPEQKKTLEIAIQAKIASLRGGDPEEDLREAVQSIVQARPKEKADKNPKTQERASQKRMKKLGDSLETTLEKVVNERLESDVEDSREEQIAEEEAVAEAVPMDEALEEATVSSPESRQEKYAKLSELVHEYDAVMKKALGEEEAPEEVKGTDTPLYTGDARNQVPAVKEVMYEGEPNYPVPALVPEGGKDIELHAIKVNETLMPDELKPSKIELAREGVALERAEMLQSEAEYLRAYKAFQKKNGLVRFWKERVMGSNSAELEKLRDLKSKYEGAQVRYAKGLNESVVKRLTEKGKSPAEIEKILKRYNGIVRFNEIVKPSKERQYEAHREALNQRGQDALSGAFNYAARKNKEFEEKYGKNTARVIRVLASTLFVTGLAATAGSLAAAGPLAIALYGGARFGKSLIGILAGASAGEAVGGLYEGKARKEQDKAKEELVKLAQDTDRMSGEFSARNISAFVDKFVKLEEKSSDVERMKKVALTKALTAFIVGGGVTGVLNALESASLPDAPSAGNTSGADAPPANPTSPGASTVNPNTVPTSPETITTPEGGGLGKIPTIDTPGEGTDSLFLELKDMLRAQYPDPTAEGVPPMVRHILDPEMHQNELSRQFGLAWGTALDGSQSQTMYMGNTMTIENGNLVLDQGGVKTVFSMGANGEMVRLDASGAPVSVEAPVPQAPSVEQAPPVPQPEAPAPSAPEATTNTLPPGVPEGSIRFNGQWISPEGVVVSGVVAAESTPAVSEEISSMIGGPIPESAPVPDAEAVASAGDTRVPESVSVAPETVDTAADGTADTATGAVEARTEFVPASASIREVIASPLWATTTQADSFAVFTMAPPVGSPEAGLRAELFDVLRDTGVGPRQGESLENYLARANEAVLNRPAGAGPSTLGVYRVGDTLVARGGDFNARSVLAYEYMRDPSAPATGVMVEGPEGTPMRAYTREAIATGVYPPSPMPIPDASALGAKVF